MRNTMTLLVVVVVVMVLSGPAYAAVGYDFNVTNGTWVTGGNWSPTAPTGGPTASDYARICGNRTALIGAGDSAVATYTDLGRNSAYNEFTLGTITQDGGSLVTTADIGFKGPGVYNISGGYLALKNPSYVGVTGGTGTLNLSGTGQLAGAWSGWYGNPSGNGWCQQTFVGGANSTGAINQTDTGISAYFVYLKIATEANSTGQYEIDNGSLVTLWGFNIGAGGTFHVVGSNSTITHGFAHDNGGATQYDQAAGSTLKCTLDSSGITTINVAYEIANFATGSIVDMVIPGDVTVNQNDYFDLLTAPSITGMPSLAADDVGVWGLSIVSGSDTLRATYLVPEPTTMALLGLGGIGVLLRRRRRRR